MAGAAVGAGAGVGSATPLTLQDIQGMYMLWWLDVTASDGEGGKRPMEPTVLGRYIVADPRICHGKPTFRGTRIMVTQVLEQVASGMAWEAIVEEWRGSVSMAAIAEAVRLAFQAFVDHEQEYRVALTSA